MATNKKDKAPAAKASYVVTSPLQHDMELYQVGDPIELTDAEAAPLLGRAVKPADAAGDAPKA